MNLFLDTHVLLWWLDDNSRLSKQAKNYIADVDNIIFVSAVVIWEIRIKEALGKLEIAADFFNIVKQQGFEILSITAQHANKVGDIPMHHRDPFDRMLIAQAIEESLTIVTHDRAFKAYEIPLIEA
ncbi:MAG: type II toxin-antitoxin system VapC family toxin [Deltaproteobacteria bacterium]|nr:type II toxin-antitoxin system VapC family toxin [Deltaproteobacteria bacterium]MBT4089824.1 type II toxin-antitoxin system VapC family toxin [Deltaproteobacteria bacterium]MBT4265513.1 type II toxin-antitoxin system VapC family toxin [Deltaproteobacteria bacterium]MBT4638307.1 type II toxin-antitoxin system VapC family toxin [Deltaproteobacteria bacterium]MBT6503573.1 type II toxin-antitoxin system VapC family toxin [Deltaproteobacteria bacterium]